MFASSRRSCLRRHTREQGRSPDETARAQRLASRSRSRSLPGRRGSPFRLQGPVLGQPDQQQENRERQGGPARRPGPRSLPDSEEAWRVARRRLGRQKALPGTVVRGTEGLGGPPCTPSSERPVAVCLVSSGCSGRGCGAVWDAHVRPSVHVYAASLPPPTSVSTYLYSHLCRNLYPHPHPYRKTDLWIKV